MGYKPANAYNEDYEDYAKKDYIIPPSAAHVPFGGNPTLANGLIHYWAFSGSNDSSFAARNPAWMGYDSVGTVDLLNNFLVDKVTSLASGLVGRGARSYSPAAASDLRYTSPVPDMHVGLSGITIQFWLSKETGGSGPSSETVFMLGDGNTVTTDYFIREFGGNFSCVFNGTLGGTALVQTDSTLSTTWKSFIFQYDPATRKASVSVNGGAMTLGGTALGVGETVHAVGLELIIALQGAGSDPLLLDEVGVWNRLLTPTEITALYNGGAGLTY